MEIRARYTLIGLFALAVIGAGFVFVYWLDKAGGLGSRAHYRIAFDGPVSGLLRGSGVLFNGIRVGEVTSLRLDAANPRTTMVGISIDRQAPVRSDTRVTIEFQGLTGAPVISLVGGDATSASVSAQGAEAPLLVAEKDAGQGMGQAARDVLRHIDQVVTTNADPLKSLIANVDKFAGALARNSDRVDGIVAGLERLTGGGPAKPQPKIFELAAAHAFGPIAKLPAVQLGVPEPMTLTLYETEKILTRLASGEAPALERAQWPDLLPKVIQARMIQSFENAGYLRAVGRTADALKPDNQLLIEVRAFHVAAGPPAVAEVELSARIVDAEGRVKAARVFRHGAPASSMEAGAVAEAISAAFVKAAADIVTWTLGTL